MRRCISILLILWGNFLWADEIYFTDGRAIDEVVDNVPLHSLQYTPSNICTFETTENFYFNRVVYDETEAENFQKLDDSGTVYLINGAVIRASNIVVSEKNIEFIDEKGRKQVYGSLMVSKIVYSNGSVAGSEIIKKDDRQTGFKKKLFLELEIGWNGYTGLGGRVDYRIFDHVSINGGAGIGYWGPRFSGALRFYLKYPYGGAFSIGAAHNLGDKSFKTEEETGEFADKEEVVFSLKPVTTINATWLYSWRGGNRNRFYIETGFAYAIQRPKYTYTSQSGHDLSTYSRIFWNVMAPGGLIFTVGYSFAIF